MSNPALLDLIHTYTHRAYLQEKRANQVREYCFGQVLMVLLKLKRWPDVERLQAQFIKPYIYFATIYHLIQNDQLTLAEQFLSYRRDSPHPQQAQQFTWLGKAYVKRGEISKGLEWLRQAHTQNSSDPMPLTEIALAGYTNEALDLANRIIGQHPAREDQWNLQGRRLPGDQNARYEILKALVRVGRIEEAQPILDQLYDPLIEILCLWEMALYQQPIETARLLAAFQSLPERALFASPVVATLLLVGDREQAIILAHLYPTHLESFYDTARQLVKHGQLVQTLNLAEQLHYPEGMWHGIVATLLEQEQVSLAESYLPQINNNDRFQVIYALEMAMLQQGDLTKAQDYLSQIPVSDLRYHAARIEFAYAAHSVDQAAELLRMVIPSTGLKVGRKAEIQQNLIRELLAAGQSEAILQAVTDRLYSHIEITCTLALATDQPLQVILAMLQTLAEFTPEWRTFYLEFKAAIDG